MKSSKIAVVLALAGFLIAAPSPAAVHIQLSDQNSGTQANSLSITPSYDAFSTATGNATPVTWVGKCTGGVKSLTITITNSLTFNGNASLTGTNISRDIKLMCSNGAGNNLPITFNGSYASGISLQSIATNDTVGVGTSSGPASDHVTLMTLNLALNAPVADGDGTVAGNLVFTYTVSSF